MDDRPHNRGSQTSGNVRSRLVAVPVRPSAIWQNQNMRNDRLREAMDRAAVSVDQLAEAVEVDPKSVWRWTNKGERFNACGRSRT